MNVTPITHCVKIIFSFLGAGDTLPAMRIIPALFFFAFLQSTLLADDSAHATASGGLSPDGRYEVLIYQDDSLQPSNYFYGVFDARRTRLLAKLSTDGGFCDYAGALKTSVVVWNPTSTEFALLDHGTRHSMDLYVYRVASTHAVAISLPDYLGEALGRVGAKSCYATSVVGPIKWNETSLDCHLIFDASTEQGRSGFYETTFTLKPGPAAGKMALAEMTAPSEKN